MEIIKLQCGECEYKECPYSHAYIPHDSLEGCTRKVSEDIKEKYFHLLKEVAPFMYLKTSAEYQSRTYHEIIEFLYNNIYSAPFGQKLDKNGKVKNATL